MLPPDIPRCRGLKPGMPCPVPQECDCLRIDREMDAAYRIASKDNFITLYIVGALLVVFVVTMLALWKVSA